MTDTHHVSAARAADTIGEALSEDFAKLSDVLRYEPNTGRFYWRRDVGARAKAGSEAGCSIAGGYRTAKVQYHGVSA